MVESIRVVFQAKAKLRQQLLDQARRGELPECNPGIEKVLDENFEPRDSLPWLALISVESAVNRIQGGRLSLAAFETSLSLLVGGSHRLATDQEFNTFEAEQAARRAQYERDDARLSSKSKTFSVVLPPEKL